MKTQKCDYDIFLSYTQRDKPWVSEFAVALEAAGLKTLFERPESLSRKNWQEKLQEALRLSSVFVIILSKHSVESPWTFFELGAAVADQKRIVTVLTDEIDLKQRAPLLLPYQFLKESSPQEAARSVARFIEKKRLIPVDVTKRETIHDPWQQENESTLLSPSIDKHWEQIVLFRACNEVDYAIEFDLTLIAGQTLHNKLYKDVGVILRYTGDKQYYYAGVGGFGARTFIGMVDNNKWRCLASQQVEDEIKFGQTYRLRLECQGANISLYEEGMKLLSVDTKDYPTGCWGLRTVRTQARFANIKQGGQSTPKAFVVMPLTPELKSVYEIVKDVLERAGLEYHRVDDFATDKLISEDIRGWLANADLIIADITSRNPNVYYEAGFAQALDKKMILLAQSKETIAFDSGFIRTLHYDDPKELREKLLYAVRDLLAERRTSQPPERA